MKTSTTHSILVVLLTFVFADPSPSMVCECIVSGETKSVTIEFPGEAHCYYFPVEAGRGIVAKMAPNSTSGSFAPRLMLYDPDGILVVDSRGGFVASIENYQLEKAGIYTVVASGLGVSTGEYSYGQVESITAVANPDFEFVRWEGSAVDANKVVIEYQDSTESTALVTVDDAYTLTAVFEEVIDGSSLDSDPGWIIEGQEGQWEFGEPTGQGGEEYGNPDPTSGYTGPNVFGVNLNGDYDVVNVGPLCSIIAGPFDLTGYSDVNLRFARWLNTDEPRYVTASVDVLTDGENWRTVWGSETEVLDSQWVGVKYPLDNEADDQPAVYLRWTYQVVGERAFRCSGWNLDDIRLCGKRQ